ncbi:hypothetical protein GCM10010399_61150 [Dactylosporangium fulvum]|uniref:Uncharacterized protein n=1 Tax=Dactylosporangium fulvum TaxID=53359 RepID=A0ABY5VZY8_9ACTN|nr:hypothetical protein Dfulv_02965 [Dactylosporangium fulvum]
MDPMRGTAGVAPAAFEAKMTITPDTPTPWPRLESDAFRISRLDLVTWGLDHLDAYQLVSQAGEAPATRWSRLGAAAVYEGVHDRLRRIAAAL